jgi:hypothetical protein
MSEMSYMGKFVTAGKKCFNMRGISFHQISPTGTASLCMRLFFMVGKIAAPPSRNPAKNTTSLARLFSWQS